MRLIPTTANGQPAAALYMRQRATGARGVPAPCAGRHGAAACRTSWRSSTPRCSRSSGCQPRCSRRVATYATRSRKMRATTGHSAPCRLQRGTRPGHDDMRSVPQHVGADADDHPTTRQQFGKPVDVVSPLRRVSPVLHTVVLDADLELLISHVDPGERSAEVDPPQRSGSAVSAIPRRSSTSRVRVSCGDSAPPSIRSSTSRSWTTPRTPRCRSTSAKTSTACKPVACASASNRMTACVAALAPAQIERRAGGCRRGNTPHQSDLVVIQFVAVNDYAVHGVFHSAGTTRRAVARQSTACHTAPPPIAPRPLLGASTTTTPLPLA